MTIRTSLSALILCAACVGSVAAADCPACRDIKAPQDYLACMKTCLADNSTQTSTPAATTSPLDKFAKDAESAGWTLSKKHDTVTDVTSVSVSKASIEALKVSDQPMEVTLTFAADSKAVGGLYLRAPDLSDLKSIPFLSIFDSMVVSALFGSSVTTRVDKNEAVTLPVRSTKDGIYLEGSEKLLPQMTSGGLLTVRLSGNFTAKTDLYFDLRGFKSAAQWVQLSVGGIKAAPEAADPDESLSDLEKLFGSFLELLPSDNTGSRTADPVTPKNDSDLMKF